MSEVPNYELLFNVNDYVVGNMYSSRPCSFPIDYQDNKRSVGPSLSVGSNKEIFSVGPITPPNETVKSTDILRRMSDAEVFNMFDRNMFSSTPSPTPMSPATTNSYSQEMNIHLQQSCQSYNHASSFMACSPKSELSDSENDHYEISFSPSRPAEVEYVNGSATKPEQKPPTTKPKRKTRLCALSSEEKSERRKKQNRLAASRCRKKKQAALTSMECTANTVKAENNELRNEIESLKKIIEEMRKEKACPSCNLYI